MRRTLVTVGVLAVVAVTSGCSQVPGPWPPPPRLVQISGNVLLSPDGRVITAAGLKACGRRPLLIARSYPHRVTLTWLNPDTNCNAESIFRAVVSTSLPAPLGRRTLVQASDGTRIAYQRADSNSPATPAFAACLQYFWPHVRHAMMTTVAAVNNVGPRTVHAKPGPLDRYKRSEPVALCLVPSGPGKFKAVAIVLISGVAYVRWTQNTGNRITFPSLFSNPGMSDLTSGI